MQDWLLLVLLPKQTNKQTNLVKHFIACVMHLDVLKYLGDVFIDLLYQVL